MSSRLGDATVGSILAEYQTEVITRERLALYAEASGDLNPLHLDPAFARKAGFDDVIAHGMLGMALLGRFLTEKFSAAPLSQFSARFTGIIKVDQALLCRARLAARSRNSVTLELEALDAAGKLVISGSAVLATGA